MDIFTLEELKETITLFSATQADFFTENCIVALEHHYKTSGCVLNVSGDTTKSFEIKWSKAVKKNGYIEHKKFIEKSAEALSFFLTKHLTEYEVFEEASIGEGVDYWLCYGEKNERYNPENFFNARLEVSGIGEETPQNSVKARVKIKMKQTVPTDGTKLPVYISVIEHSTPKAYFGKK